jgi:hypothetical protein
VATPDASRGGPKAILMLRGGRTPPLHVAEKRVYEMIRNYSLPQGSSINFLYHSE